MNDVRHKHLLEALKHPVLQDEFAALILVLDRQGRIVSFNRACEMVSGYAESEVRGRHFDFLLPEDQRQNVHQVFDTLVRQGALTNYANAWIDRQGQEHFIQWSNTVLRDDDGATAYVIATGIDVTRYREASRNWIDADNRYRSLVEISADIIWDTDSNGIYRYVSPRVRDVLGYAPEEIIGQPADTFMYDAAEIRYLQEYLRQPEIRRDGFQHFINRRRHKAGHEVILSCSGTPYFDMHGELLGFRGTSRDITELHRMEQRLRESEQRLRLSQHFAHIGTWDWHIESGELFWSEEIWPIFGQQRETFQPSYENFLSTVHPEDRDRVLTAIECCLADGERYDVEHRIRWPDGSVHWVREIGNIQTGDDGRPTRMLGVVMPIDERKQAEQRLLASERRYRFLVENAADAIAMLDEQANILEVNQRACDLFDRTRDELLGTPLCHYSPAGCQAQHEGVYQRIVQADAPVTEEIRIRTPDGRVIPVELRATRLSLAQGSQIQVILRDISERRAQEEARLRQEKRQRNALVREVHHRIKNNLQGILGLLRLQARECDDPRQLIDNAISQIQSIALVHGIHGQRADGQLRLCEMLPAIVDALTLHESRHQGHELCMDIDHPLAVQESESVALALILNELLTNASKHANAPDRPLSIRLTTRQETGGVRIFSPGARLPDDFDFSRCLGCNTGLELVRALLPKKGARLVHTQLADGVRTELDLFPPIVQRGTGDCCPPADYLVSKKPLTGDVP